MTDPRRDWASTRPDRAGASRSAASLRAEKSQTMAAGHRSGDLLLLLLGDSAARFGGSHGGRGAQQRRGMERDIDAAAESLNQLACASVRHGLEGDIVQPEIASSLPTRVRSDLARRIRQHGRPEAVDRGGAWKELLKIPDPIWRHCQGCRSF